MFGHFMEKNNEGTTLLKFKNICTKTNGFWKSMHILLLIVDIH